MSMDKAANLRYAANASFVLLTARDDARPQTVEAHNPILSLPHLDFRRLKRRAALYRGSDKSELDALRASSRLGSHLLSCTFSQLRWVATNETGCGTLRCRATSRAEMRKRSPNVLPPKEPATWRRLSNIGWEPRYVSCPTASRCMHPVRDRSTATDLRLRQPQ